MTVQVVKSGAARRFRIGDASPLNVETPLFVGEEYFDTVANVWWKAIGGTSAEWESITPEIQYDDLTVPATAVNPPGQEADPDWDTTTPGWLFDGASLAEVLHIVVQLPHSYLEGGDLYPHVHWMKTTSASGNVEWKMEYKWANIGEVLDANWTPLTKNTTVSATPDTNTANKHLITALGTIAGEGRQISDMLLIKLSRDPTVDGDTYGADARLIEFDIHYPKNSNGSRQEFVK